MAKYKLYKVFNFDGTTGLGVTDKESSPIKNIPFDEGNTDYQEYLAWKAEGNEPEAAD